MKQAQQGFHIDLQQKTLDGFVVGCLVTRHMLRNLRQPWRTLVQIMLPLAANGIVVVANVNFVAAWGEFLYAYTLLNDRLKFTFPVVLATTFGGFGEWAFPRVAAMYIMAIIPGILAFTILQRWYMKGLQEGALKF